MADTVIPEAAFGQPSVPGNRRRWLGTYTIVDNYATNGIVLTPALFGLVNVDYAIASPATAGTRYAVWDNANGKLKLFTSSTGAEVAAGASAAGDIYNLEVIGI